MPVDETSLGKVVVISTAQGNFHAIGQMVIYAEEPTIGVMLPNGQIAHWRADMARLATPEETAIVQALAPAQNDCSHEKGFGRLAYTESRLLCGRCRKAVSE
jgi:hypothetical protein